MSDDSVSFSASDVPGRPAENLLLVSPPGSSAEYARLVETLEKNLSLSASILYISSNEGWGSWVKKLLEHINNTSIVVVDVTDMHPISTYAVGYVSGNEGLFEPISVPIASTEKEIDTFSDTHLFSSYPPNEREIKNFVEEVKERIEKETLFRLSIPSDEMEVETADSISDLDDGIPASIYLPDDAPLLKRDRLTTAVGEFMEAMGFEPEQEEEPTLGSWYQELWFKAKNFFSQEEVQQAYKDGYDALKANVEGSTAAEQTSELAAAASELIGSLEDVPNAAIRLGNLILLKQTVAGDSRIDVETVSPSLMRELEGRDLLTRGPKEVRQFINERRSESEASESSKPEKETEQLPGEPQGQETSGKSGAEAPEA